MLEQALFYASCGVPVVPVYPIREDDHCACGDPQCTRVGKHVMGSGGFQSATRNPKAVEQMWRRTPDAGIAGVPTDHVVIDLDPRHDGFRSLSRLEEEHGSLPMDCVAETGESKGVRGQHRWFKVDEPIGKKDLAPGFELKGYNGYVIMPPSPHASGVRYQWRAGSNLREIPRLPEWVRELIDLPRQVLNGNSARSGLRLSPRAYRFKVEGAPSGTQRLEALAVARALWGAGYEVDEAIEWIAEGLMENSQQSDEPWTQEEVEELVRDIYRKPPPPVDAKGRREHDLTDEGNASRLVEEYGMVIRFVPSMSSWLTWNGKRWIRDEGDEVLTSYARRVIDTLEEEAIGLGEDGKPLYTWMINTKKGRKVPLMIEKARTIKPCPARLETFDADPFLLNCQNGVLNLRTCELSPHSLDLHQRKIVPLEYHEDKRSSIFERFLEETTLGDKDLQEFLQRIYGYSLTGSTEAHKLFFLYGPPASGKTTILEAFRAVLGPYSRVLPPEILTRRGLDRSKPEIASLPGARFVTASELEKGETFADAYVSDLTGGSMIKTRELYGHPFEFLPQFKLFIAANNAPTINSTGSGIWRRLIRIPFDHAVPEGERDPSIVKALCTTEREAILAWAVEGARKWLASKDRTFEVVPERVRKSKEEYESAANRFAPFFAEELEFTGDPTDNNRTKDLYDFFLGWCDAQGIKQPMTNRSFAEELKQHGAVKADRGGVARWACVRVKSNLFNRSQKAK